MRRKHLMIIALMLVFVILMTGCSSPDDGSTADSEQGGSIENSENGVNDEDVKLYFDQEMPDIVMKINGQEIHKDKILAEYEKMKVLYESVGIDINSKEIQLVMQEALLSNTISTVILSQEADKAGVVISDKQVKAKMDEVVSEYESEEEFNAMLSRLNVSPEELEEQIRNQLKVSKFLEDNTARMIESNSELDFTDEEKKQLYEMFDAKLGGMPDYDDMKDEVDGIFEDSKVEILVGSYIQELVDNSEIELFLE